MPTYFSSMTLRRLGALTAFIASALTIACLIGASILVLDRMGRANVERYGSTIANLLSGLSAAGVATQNHVPLSIMTAHVADDPAIINAAIFNRDNHLLSSGGRVSMEATLDAPTDTVFKRTITFEGVNYGYVRIVIDPGALAPALQHWLWLAAALGALLATWCGALLGARVESHLARIADRLSELAPAAPFRTTTPARATNPTSNANAALPRLHNIALGLVPDDDITDDGAADHRTGPPPYLVVLNLFNLSSLSTAERDDVLARCADRVEQVCELYSGSVVRLPNTGLFALLDAREDHDHAFHAVCATLLAMRLMTDLNTQRVAQGQAPLLVRAGVLRLTQHPNGQDAATLREELESILSDGILLSATAKNGALLADREVFQALIDAQRLHWAAVRTPITTSTSGSEPGFHYQITGVTTAVEPLLAAQAQRLIAEAAE